MTVRRGTHQEIVGRSEELASLERFLGHVAHAGCVVIEGEPGIGKTAVWSAALRALADQSRVLAASPAEAEAPLSFATLGDLLRNVAGEAAALPDPQRYALETALLLAEAKQPMVADRHAVGVATLGLLRVLAEGGPLVVAVDDAHWTDPASARALQFALRRLDAEPIAILVARRTGSADPLDLRRSLRRHQLLQLGPLATRELTRILRSRFGPAVPYPTLVRLAEASGGNPFYAFELAFALVDDGPASAREFLPIPASLRALIQQRLERQPNDVRSALLTVAALRSPSPALVDSVSGPGSVARAADARLIEVVGHRLRPAHPLLGSIVYADAAPAARRRLHRQLAAIVSDREERARHLALAANRPDDEVAAELDHAARLARTRGAAEAAAELGELALALTPEGAADSVRRRRVAAGEYHFEAGDPHASQERLHEALQAVEGGRERAHVLWRLGSLNASVAGPAAAVPLYLEAVDEAEGDAGLLARLHERLAIWRWVAEGAVAAEPHAQSFLELAERLGRPEMLARALGTVLFVEVLRGRGLDRRRYQRILEIEREHPDAGVELPGSALHCQLLTFAGHYEEARARIDELVARAQHRGDAAQIVPVYSRAWLDIREARWPQALEQLDAMLELADQTGREALVPMLVILRAFALAYLGETRQAINDAERGGREADARGEHTQVLLSRVPRALVSLSLGDHQGARDLFASVAVETEPRGEWGAAEFWLPDEIEARAAVRDLESATRRLAPFEALAQSLDLGWMLATATRARGILSFAAGDAASGLRTLERAERLHECWENDFERGRTLLALGRVRRRLRQKTAARHSLTCALELFEAASAQEWAHRAREELGRISGRHPAPRQLTEAEQQILSLVVDGYTNREVGERLFVSIKTVERHLTHIFQKLDVSSRRELIRRFASRQPSRS